MALKVFPIWVYANHSHSQLGVSCFVQNKKKFHLLNDCRVNLAKFESFGVHLTQSANTHVEDERIMSLNLSDFGSSSTDEKIDEPKITEFEGFYKDLDFLPKPLSAIVAPISDGSKVRVAYQGSPGAYSETAALKAYPICKTVPCDQIESVFKAVELWLVDKGVLPIENSVGGSIHHNYDLLVRHRLHIIGEVEVAVNHCLLGLHGVTKEELTHVLSHPQALEQCEITLNKLGIEKVRTEDTADASQIVAMEGIREIGAISSFRAAEIYGLDILEQTIQDVSDNITRFLILAREPIIPRTDKPHKTSIVFALEEGPGVLFKALAIFALRDINLLKVISSFRHLVFLIDKFFYMNQAIFEKALDPRIRFQIESRPQKKRPLRIVDDSKRGVTCTSTIYFTSTLKLQWQIPVPSVLSVIYRNLPPFFVFLVAIQ